MINHFRNDCARLFLIIQILEIFLGTEYGSNKMCPVKCATRHKREDYCIKTLRIIYPYDLNERARKDDIEVPVRKLFFSIPRTKQRSARYRNNNDYLKNDTITYIYTNIHNTIRNDIKNPIKFA